MRKFLVLEGTNANAYFSARNLANVSDRRRQRERIRRCKLRHTCHH